MNCIKFKPNLVYYVDVNSFNIVQKRVENRNRYCEKKMDINYCKDLFNLYKKMVSEIYPEYRSIDNSLDFSDNEDFIKQKWFIKVKLDLYN